jgi:ankyrin repeat protein
MNRKGLVQIRSVCALMLALLGPVGVGLIRVRQERLNASLADALQQYDLGAVRSLLRQGASIRTRGGHGETPVIVAIAHQDLRFVDDLLERGAEVNGVRSDPCGHDTTALISALGTPHPEVLVRKLLERGANPNERDLYGCTVLLRAAQEGQTELVRVLLAHGADIQATPDGSILSWLWVEEKPEIVRLLRHAGAKD